MLKGKIVEVCFEYGSRVRGRVKNNAEKEAGIYFEEVKNYESGQKATWNPGSDCFVTWRQVFGAAEIINEKEKK